MSTHSSSDVDARAIADSESKISAVLERFHGRTTSMAGAFAHANAASAAVKNEIAESLVQLQFQDRVSQILSSVSKSMGEFVDPELHAQGPDEEAQQKLQEMAQTYTTDEQRRIHHGLEAESVEPQAITFF